MTLGDIGGDGDAEGSKTMQEKGTKRQNQDVLYQWELLPVRALQPGKRSRLEAATTYEQLYTWMAEAPTKNVYTGASYARRRLYTVVSAYPGLHSVGRQCARPMLPGPTA